ncbi:MAG: phytanoyl-CoA dioxygenase family protein [Pseudomonadales bacterium]|nr:phytanoyl-CoA dioxygenase family protein [Pseudomonadales bacterium]MBO6594474.1 phytanoyl-CoA dioxygenase family protein [Pseudomonadales bacterium]MBO6821965.1 phytanoyl-CoA dioxygenase family protein [Pseudomonadales bacterium]
MTLLNSEQMASFAARGFLKMDAVVPENVNRQFLEEVGSVPEDGTPESFYGHLFAEDSVPVVAAGTPLSETYQAGSANHRLINLPEVAGAIQSLVGSEPTFDHHFLHVTFPPRFYKGHAPRAQHTHQDSTIDPRSAFDVQIMYFPHEVTPEMGGTRFVPGTHLRVVSEASISRYQNIAGQQHIVCPAGTLLFMHMGIWHGGGANESDDPRFMFKIRLCPTERQARLWDDSDLPDDHSKQDPIFWTGVNPKQPIHEILTRPEPWFEMDTGRLEYLNRIRFWRYLLGDSSFDADYWLTRIENEYV